MRPEPQLLRQVEATKFTEVGFHGRDVDQIIRDLVDNAIVLVRAKLRRVQAIAIAEAVEGRILDALVGSGPAANPHTRVRAATACCPEPSRAGPRPVCALGSGRWAQGQWGARRCALALFRE